MIEVDRDRQHGTVMLAEPAVEARVVGDRLHLGQEATVRLMSADYPKGAVEFELLGGN